MLIRFKVRAFNIEEFKWIEVNEIIPEDVKPWKAGTSIVI